MRRKTELLTTLISAVAFWPSATSAKEALLFDGRHVAGVIYEDERTMAIASQLLSGDLETLTGQKPLASTNLADCRRVCVVVGRQDSELARTVAAEADVDLSELQGQWERYARLLVKSKRRPGTSYLLIAGSDTRGTVWGIVDLTRELGVSPWEWWADVTPRRAKRLVADGTRRRSVSPSVQYRGIFLNDEDWGLQPWAAKTFEPETGDIGPKTYSRIFELMWRLKANVIWPAMHESTKPFYQISGNAKAASDYAIVVGTSHAEPMMRNNVREWYEGESGRFNFFINRAPMIDYWRRRVEEVKGFENIYTIGLRGKHDSAMEGADTPEKAREAMVDVMGAQRELLARAQGKPASQVPQVLTLYKEVLDVYATGLDVPDDVTLVWPEDNYGYLNQLSTPAEQKRAGGSGIYYHISYWGRPHDYLWLGTTHPALIREQLDRAWRMNARKIWVVNVGDIKPGEYLTQYFLEMAFDHQAIEVAPHSHLVDWATKQFGVDTAADVAAIMTEFYDLAFERRPEFMGFDQVETIQPNRISDYVRSGGQEAERRLDRYAAIVQDAERLAARMPADRADAFFQLVLYPVRSAASLNERILKIDLANLHAKAGRAPVAAGISSDEGIAAKTSAAPRADSNALSREAKAAQERILADTASYNAQRGGKWDGIMNHAPRDLPVFKEPLYARWDLPADSACGLEATDLTFVAGRPATHAFTLYSAGRAAAWSLSGQRGVTPSVREGQLEETAGFRQRIKLTYDGGPSFEPGSVTCAGTKFEISARLVTPGSGMPPEIGRVISISANDAQSAQWEVVPGLGSRGVSLRSRLELPSIDFPLAGAPLVYPFETAADRLAQLRVVALPVHPLTSSNGLRIAVQIDDAPPSVLNFESYGRSDEWKQNVLTNSAVRTIALSKLPAGKHEIRIYALDPGFILDRIDIRFDGAPEDYGAPPVK